MAAKTDLDRIGLFSEMGYTSIGDPYVPPNNSECIQNLLVSYLFLSSCHIGGQEKSHNRSDHMKIGKKFTPEYT